MLREMQGGARAIKDYAPDTAGPTAPEARDIRPRARDIGIDIGVFRPGRLNAITDVAGVGVGHCTLVSGEGKLVPGIGPVRTGVTVVVPHAGNLFEMKTPAAAFALNAFGKAIGLAQLNELGNLETPIALTNTLNAPVVADALIEWSISRNPAVGITTSTVNPVVGEVNDGFLNDIQGRHVRKEHVLEAIARALDASCASAEAGSTTSVGAGAVAGAAAIPSARFGRAVPVEEGSIGAGTGACCMGWKGGIGTASRVLPKRRGGYTVGALVLTNFGGVLTVNGAPVGRELGRYAFKDDFPYEPNPSVAVGSRPRPACPHEVCRPGEGHLSPGSGGPGRPAGHGGLGGPGGSDGPGVSGGTGAPGGPGGTAGELDGRDQGGSVIVVLATDAPLDHRQLERLARRAGLGLSRTGFFSSNGSGDFFIAFSTAWHVPHRPPLTLNHEVVSNDAMSALFLAAVEATEEAVINSILRATTVVGRDGNVADAIDIDDLLGVLRKYNALHWQCRLPPWDVTRR